jgi:hypothetical protein
MVLQSGRAYRLVDKAAVSVQCGGYCLRKLIHTVGYDYLLLSHDVVPEFLPALSYRYRIDTQLNISIDQYKPR